jgi:hypothetical protein
MKQEKSERNVIFSDKSERLAQHLGINLDALPARIGISKDMFYAYRTGRHAISEKAWRKLEQAGRAAGLREESDREPQQPTPSKSPALGFPFAELFELLSEENRRKVALKLVDRLIDVINEHEQSCIQVLEATLRALENEASQESLAELKERIQQVNEQQKGTDAAYKLLIKAGLSPRKPTNMDKLRERAGKFL